jgi:hypothetical protein
VSRFVAGGLTLIGLFLLSGCTTTHTQYAPDGKTISGITKVGIGHEIQFPDGVKVTTSKPVVDAAEKAVLRAIETGGATFTQRAAEVAAEAALRSSTGNAEPTKGE